MVELLPKVQAPTLVLHCRHDNVAPLEQGRLIARTIPHARVVTLESDNHVLLAGEPAWQKLVDEIEAFLADRAPHPTVPMRHDGLPSQAQSHP